MILWLETEMPDGVIYLRRRAITFDTTAVWDEPELIGRRARPMRYFSHIGM
jgi:hypothetical protein